MEIKAILVGLSFGVAIVHAASAAAAERQFAVRTIDEVAAGGLPIVKEITATSATIDFQSSIPLACSVVFGETEAFGAIATDSDMGGGGHTDHNPVLAGLKPSTEYFFRVQGAATDGTIYVGEVRNFRTSALDPNARANLADMKNGAKILGVSSNYGGGANADSWGAEGAIDGNQATAWSSASDGDDAFLEVGFARAENVAEITVWSRQMSDGTARILSFIVTDDAGTAFGPFALPDADQAHQFEIGTNTKALRLDVVESTGGNVGLIEFGAFGDERR